jgi:hypothetical protein
MSLLQDTSSSLAGSGLNVTTVSSSSWLNAVNNSRVLDGRGSTVTLYELHKNRPDLDETKFLSSPPYNSFTVGQQLGIKNGQTKVLSEFGGNRVFVNPQYIERFDSISDVAGLLAHEALHLMGLADTEILLALGMPKDSATSGISGMLAEFCFGSLRSPALLP